MAIHYCGEGDNAVILSAIISLQIAKGLTPAQLTYLGGIFASIGDQLNTMAASRIMRQDCINSCCPPPKEKVNR